MLLKWKTEEKHCLNPRTQLNRKATEKQIARTDTYLHQHIGRTTNLQIMWTDGWIMSNSTQDSQKVCTKLLSLPDNAKKLNFQSLS